MPDPSESDLRLLHAIVLLTEQQAGRPPTLAEVALALGYPASARGNIQRQLSRLRPDYVTWTASSRSLEVTPDGLALLGRPLPTPLQAPVDDDILYLLARGVTEAAAVTGAGRVLQTPYPTALQRGVNRLAAACIPQGIDPPVSVVAVLDWCRQPLAAWPIRFVSSPRYQDNSLLVDEAPSDLARELAQGLRGDAELELSEHRMLRIRNLAETNNAQSAYVAVRRFLIERPVLSLAALLQTSFDPQFGILGEYLGDMYEPVPLDAIVDGQLWLCGFCGWTLIRRDGRMHCADDRCRLLTKNFTVGPRPQPAPPDLRRVRRAIRRYVTAPGTYEIQAAMRLEALGLQVELWPGYDLYDLRVSFPSGAIWGIDIKDWRFPHLLAPKLTPLETKHGCNYTQAFYAIPAARVDEDPDYLTLLRHLASVPGIAILTIDDLIVRAQQEVNRA